MLADIKGHRDIVITLTIEFIKNCDDPSHEKQLFSQMDLKEYLDEKIPEIEIYYLGSKCGRNQITEQLITLGMDVNHQSQFGTIALMSASRNGHSDTVKPLIMLKLTQWLKFEMVGQQCRPL